MVDIAIKDNLKKYFNWILAWTPNAVYDEIVNWEVVRNTYDRRKSSGSFMLKKRRWFKQATWVVSWTITDIAELTDRWVTWIYVYSVTSTNFYVYKKIKWSCDALTQVDTWTRCTDMFAGFVKTSFVKWPKREIFTTGSSFDSTWDYIVTTPTYPQAFGNVAWVTYDWWATNWPTQWDYIWAYDANNTTTIPSQVRQIINRVASWYNSRDTLIVSSPREMSSSAATNTWAYYAIFPDWWDVLLYAWQDTWYMWATSLNCVKIIHSPYTIDAAWALNTTDTRTTIRNTIDKYWTTNRCVVSMVEHNDSVIIHFDNWHSIYGAKPSWVVSWYYKFYHTVEEQFYFGKDITDLASFRSFAIWFWPDKISVSTLRDVWWDTNLYAQSYNLRDNLWIRNNWARAQYDNSMYFLASDKRLYSITIKSDEDGYILDLQDQSAPFLWHLENIKEWDEIYMDITKNEIRIYHIVAWNDLDDLFVTKVIIFDKDYNFVHWWEINWRITWSLNDYYMWWWALYFLCWNTDYAAEFYDSRISAFIWDNEENWTETNLFEKKSINRGKIILWNWIYNNWYTYVNCYSRSDWRKTIQRVNGIENITWLNLYETRATTGTFNTANCINLSCCTTSLENEEKIYTWVDWWRDWDRAVADWRCWPSSFDCPTYIENVAEWIAIESPIDQISEFRTIVVPLKTQPADLIKIELVCKAWDSATFGWMFWEIQKYAFDDVRTYWDAIRQDTNCSLSFF